MSNLTPMIMERAARLRAMHDKIHTAFRKQPHGPAHTAAVSDFFTNFDLLAYPGGLKCGMERLKEHEPGAIDIAITFLEADPWFFRSGYIKEEIARRLKHYSLTKDQLNRVSAVILRSVRQGTRRLAHHLARIAPLASSTAFSRAMDSYTKSDDPEIRRRAEHVQRVIESTLVK